MLVFSQMPSRFPCVKLCPLWISQKFSPRWPNMWARARLDPNYPVANVVVQMSTLGCAHGVPRGKMQWVKPSRRFRNFVVSPKCSQWNFPGNSQSGVFVSLGSVKSPEEMLWNFVPDLNVCPHRGRIAFPGFLVCLVPDCLFVGCQSQLGIRNALVGLMNCVCPDIPQFVYAAIMFLSSKSTRCPRMGKDMGCFLWVPLCRILFEMVLAPILRLRIPYFPGVP